MEDWAEIRRLHRGEGIPIKAIARRLKISRNTVRNALAADDRAALERLMDVLAAQDERVLTGARS